MTTAQPRSAAFVGPEEPGEATVWTGLFRGETYRIDQIDLSLTPDTRFPTNANVFRLTATGWVFVGDVYDGLPDFTLPPEKVIAAALNTVEDAWFWEIQPPEIYSTDTAFQDLPEELIRRCCPSKHHWNVKIKRTARAVVNQETLQTTLLYSYRRTSNDDVYGWESTKLAEVIEGINRQEYWPLCENEDGRPREMSS